MEFTTTTYYTSKVRTMRHRAEAAAFYELIAHSGTPPLAPQVLPAAGPALVGLIFTLLTLIVYLFWCGFLPAATSFQIFQLSMMSCEMQAVCALLLFLLLRILLVRPVPLPLQAPISRGHSYLNHKVFT